jgi:hypothetical protein
MKVSEQTIKNAAQHAANWTYAHLAATSSIDNNTAAEVAKDAGDALAERLEVSLREHGVEIEKEHHAG